MEASATTECACMSNLGCSNYGAHNTSVAQAALGAGLLPGPVQGVGLLTLNPYMAQGYVTYGAVFAPFFFMCKFCKRNRYIDTYFVAT